MKAEPITHFYNSYGFDISLITRFVKGDKFFGVMLNNGSIGLCSVLDIKLSDGLLQGEKPDPENMEHRIILNAYYNAMFNNTFSSYGKGDIFSVTDFSNSKKVVMVGLFETLFKNLINMGITPVVFDNHSDADFLHPASRLSFELSDASDVVVTGTTIFNGTFMDIISATPDKCHIYLLGPSNTLHPDMLSYRNIELVFGSRFKLFDTRILDIISEGHGAKSFLNPDNKVYIGK